MCTGPRMKKMVKTVRCAQKVFSILQEIEEKRITFQNKETTKMQWTRNDRTNSTATAQLLVSISFEFRIETVRLRWISWKVSDFYWNLLESKLTAFFTIRAYNFSWRMNFSHNGWSNRLFSPSSSYFYFFSTTNNTTNKTYNTQHLAREIRCKPRKLNLAVHSPERALYSVRALIPY